MKFGIADYGVNVWDGGLYDYGMRLEELKSIGLDGIERLEAVSPSDALEKAAVFRKYGMDFATCRGPSLSTGIEWTAGLGKPYVWITPGSVGREMPLETFCRRSNKMLQGIRRWGIRGVLHNHLGQRIQNQDEVDYFMNACPDAQLLLDAGHLFAAGGDPAGTVRKYAGRIGAVHFKDVFIKDASKDLTEWNSRLRFCELGAGNAGMTFQPIADALMETGYNGWIFIEHDTHTDEPVKQLKISFDVLKKIFKKA